MPFNVEEHANLGYIDREYKDKLETMRIAHKRTLKAELETMIDNDYTTYLQLKAGRDYKESQKKVSK